MTRRERWTSVVLKLGLVAWGVVYLIQPGSLRDTLLCDAARADGAIAMKALLWIGAEPEGLVSNGENALTTAVIFDSPAALRVLASRAADPNAPNRFGETPLGLAMGYERNEVIRELRALRARGRATP